MKSGFILKVWLREVTDKIYFYLILFPVRLLLLVMGILLSLNVLALLVGSGYFEVLRDDDREILNELMQLNEFYM